MQSIGEIMFLAEGITCERILVRALLVQNFKKTMYPSYSEQGRRGTRMSLEHRQRLDDEDFIFHGLEVSFIQGQQKAIGEEK